MGTYMCVCKAYDDDYESVDSAFTNAWFSVGIPSYELDAVVSPLDKIIVKQTFHCLCYRFYQHTDSGEYAEVYPIPKWFPVHCGEGEVMTNRHILTELIRQGMSLDCEHRTVRGFERSSQGGDCQFDVIIDV